MERKKHPILRIADINLETRERETSQSSEFMSPRYDSIRISGGLAERISRAGFYFRVSGEFPAIVYSSPPLTA